MTVKKSLASAAYKAIERDSFSEDKETQALADQAMIEFFNKTISADKLNHYAAREKEYRQLNG